MTDKNWKWWAGEYEDEYDLAGPCDTKEEALDIAYGSHLEPRDTIYLIEAICDDEPDEWGRYDFIATRNRSTHERGDDDSPVACDAPIPPIGEQS